MCIYFCVYVFLLYVIVFLLCCFVYCLCINVYCAGATGFKTQLQLTKYSCINKYLKLFLLTFCKHMGFSNVQCTLTVHFIDKYWPEDSLERGRNMQPYWGADGCICYLYRCTVHFVQSFNQHTNQCTYINFFTLKRLKSLQHVSILRSSSGCFSKELTYLLTYLTYSMVQSPS